MNPFPPARKTLSASPLFPDAGDRLIWLWVTGKTPPIALEPLTDLALFDRLWAYVFTGKARGYRAYRAIRDRAIAYRNAGHPLANCAMRSALDLANALKSKGIKL